MPVIKKCQGGVFLVPKWNYLQFVVRKNWTENIFFFFNMKFIFATTMFFDIFTKNKNLVRNYQEIIFLGHTIVYKYSNMFCLLPKFDPIITDQIFKNQ